MLYVVKVIIGPVINRDALSWESIPRLEIKREERTNGCTLMVAEIVMSDLSVIIRQTVRISTRLGEQK